MEIFQQVYLYAVFFVLTLPLVLIVFVVSALRGDHDAAGKRSYSVYLGAASIVTLFVLLAGVYSAVSGIVDLARGDGGSAFSPSGDSEFAEFRDTVSGGGDNDEAWQQIVSGLIIAGISGFLWKLHRQKVEDLRDDADFPGSASERSLQASDYIVIFLALMLFITAAYTVLYTLVQLIAPDTFGLDERADGWEKLVMSAVLAAEAFVAFSLHREHTFLTNPPATFTPAGTSSDDLPLNAPPSSGPGAGDG